MIFNMPKRTIGLDIGSENARMVCLENNGGRFKLVGFGCVDHGQNKEKLSQFIKEAGAFGKKARVNLEDNSLKIRRLDIPPMTDEEIMEAVKWGMKDIIEGEMDDFTFQYKKILPKDIALKDKMPLIVYAVKNEAVQRMLLLAKEIGLKRPEIIEPDAAALSLALDNMLGKDRESTDIIIDIGSSWTLFTVIGASGVLYSRPLPGYSGTSFANNIMRDCGVDAEKARQMMNDHFKGVAGDIPVETLNILKNTINHYFSRMAVEIQRSIDGYSVLFQRKKVGNIFLCGGGVHYTGFREYLEQTLRLKVGILDPFLNIDTSNYAKAQIDDVRALYGIACGLALD